MKRDKVRRPARMSAGVCTEYCLVNPSDVGNPWTLRVESPDFRADKRKYSTAITGYEITLTANVARLEEFPDVELWRIVPGEVWIDSRLTTHEHEDLDLSGVVDVDELERFAVDLLKVIAEAKRLHPELRRSS